MIKLKVSEILKAIGGLLLSGTLNQTVTNINTDSRTIKQGDLFLALSGANFNGADFIEEALSKGAVGYVRAKSEEGRVKKSGRGLSPGQSSGDFPQIVGIEVDDPLRALQDLARYILNQVKPKVVAITGSTGKTNVKEMLKSILSLKYEVVASKANYNNEIGLPLTLLELKSSTQIVILEMAMRGLGQIEELCQVAAPDMAVITNVGLSHIELLKSEDNIIEAKAEIIKGLKRGGVVFLNSDDESSEQLAVSSKQLAKKIVFFGSESKANVSFSNVALDDLARPSFVLKIGNRKSCLPSLPAGTAAGTAKIENSIKLPIPGRHHASNACAAAAVALKLGLSLTEVKNGLENLKPAPGRMHVTKANEWIIVDDSYNASPASMIAAVDVLKDIKAKRKVAILGGMLELGHISLEEHQKIGKLVARSKIDQLFTVGKLAQHIGQAAVKEGMATDKIHSFSDCSKLKKEIISYLRSQDAILIKASRAIKLDEVALYLQKKR